MRILIIGASGLLGSDLLTEWSADELIPATSRDADIREIAQVRRLVASSQPDWIVLAAAYSDVDSSERHPDRAFAVNRDGTRNVAIAARENDAKLLYLSTDYLFDGSSHRPYEPGDPVHPLNVYGSSKAAGELAMQEQCENWLIVRTAWLFGASRSCFPEKILSAADTQPEIRVVNDQTGSPTYTRDLAQAMRKLLQADARGILNVTNSGSCTWFEFAREILRRAGRKTPIAPIGAAESARLAKRPAYSVLSLAGLTAPGIALRSWQDALSDYLDQLRQKGKLR